MVSRSWILLTVVISWHFLQHHQTCSCGCRLSLSGKCWHQRLPYGFSLFLKHHMCHQSTEGRTVQHWFILPTQTIRSWLRNVTVLFCVCKDTETCWEVFILSGDVEVVAFNVSSSLCLLVLLCLHVCPLLVNHNGPPQFLLLLFSRWENLAHSTFIWQTRGMGMFSDTEAP